MRSNGLRLLRGTEATAKRRSTSSRARCCPRTGTKRGSTRREQRSRPVQRVVPRTGRRAVAGQAIATLQRALRVDPIHEPAHRALMATYDRLGRRQEALAQYQRLRAALRSALEADPAAETRALYRELLAVEPDSTVLEPRGLPAELTTFVGREQELAAIAGELRTDAAPDAHRPRGERKDAAGSRCRGACRRGRSRRSRVRRPRADHRPANSWATQLRRFRLPRAGEARSGRCARRADRGTPRARRARHVRAPRRRVRGARRGCCSHGARARRSSRRAASGCARRASGHGRSRA